MTPVGCSMEFDNPTPALDLPSRRKRNRTVFTAFRYCLVVFMFLFRSAYGEFQIKKQNAEISSYHACIIGGTGIAEGSCYVAESWNWADPSRLEWSHRGVCMNQNEGRPPYLLQGCSLNGNQYFNWDGSHVCEGTSGCGSCMWSDDYSPGHESIYRANVNCGADGRVKYALLTACPQGYFYDTAKRNCQPCSPANPNN